MLSRLYNLSSSIEFVVLEVEKKDVSEKERSYSDVYIADCLHEANFRISALEVEIPGELEIRRVYR